MLDTKNNSVSMITGVIADPIVVSQECLRKIMDKFHDKESIEDMGEFIRSFRGVFSGIFYDNSRKVVYAFVDHLSSKALYYYVDHDLVIISSSYPMVLELLNAIGVKLILNEHGAYFLLSFGYMIRDSTLVKGVQKVLPGSIVEINLMDRSVRSIQYYRIDNKPVYDDVNDTINGIERRFLKAVKREFNVDSEIAKYHLITLSGGLDSRMVTLTSFELGYRNSITFTFGQSNYYDQLISRKIANDLGIRNIFIPLDGGSYLLNVNDNISINGGLVYYSNAAHLRYALSILDRFSVLSPAGIVHTGVLGDGVMGVYLRKPYHIPALPTTIYKFAISKKLLSKAVKFIDFSAYKNAEEFGIYETSINTTFNGYRVIEQFTEFYSPFTDVDFMDYVFKIHPKLRYEDNIYLEWIKNKRPVALKYQWERLGFRPIMSSKFRKINRKMIVAYRYALRKWNISPLYSMNPFDYWYSHNSSLRSLFDTLFRNGIPYVSNNELRDDVKWLYNTGSMIEKTMSVTLLATIKKFNITA
ncbi:MAG: hypothetical protein GSR79_00545 [Desulfurococcales archaeon]|nr:hypothetical protein [Desulfurococcales archaeon]